MEYNNTHTAGKAFYNRQVAFLEAKDIEGLVETQYAPDAEVVSFDFSVKGHAALKTHFTNYLQNLGDFKAYSTDKFVETEDTIFFEATIQVSGGLARVYNAFVLKDGVASHHFTGRLDFIPNP
jgi:hypothetical protein